MRRWQWEEGGFGEEYYGEGEGQAEDVSGGYPAEEERPQSIPPEIAPDVSFPLSFLFSSRVFD